MHLFLSPPQPQKPSSCDWKWSGSCPLHFVLYLRSALKWTSFIIFQPSATKPSVTPGSLHKGLQRAGKGWLRASHKRWGFTWEFARGRRKTGKKKKPKHLPMLTGVFGGWGTVEGKERKIKMGRNITFLVPSGCPLARLARTLLRSQGWNSFEWDLWSVDRELLCDKAKQY